MPDLPRILARPDLPTANLPRVNAAAAAAPWTELTQAANEWTRALEKKAPVDAALQSSEYNIAAEQWKNEVMVQKNEDGTLSPSDPATWVPAFRAKEKEERAARLAAISDPRVAKFLNTHANKTLDEHIKELNKRAVETVHGQTAAKAQTSMENFAQFTASTDNEVLKKTAKDTFEALIKTAESPTKIGNQIFPPAFVKGEGDKLREKYNEEVQKRTVYFKLDNNPRQLLEDLKNPTNFSYLTGPEREAVRSHANTRINEQKQIAKEVDKDAMNAQDTEFLKKLDRGTLNTTEVLNNPTIDFPRKKFWEEKIHDRAKERARENRELDPYEKSDGATRALVMNGVFTNPKAWPPDRIMTYAGKGLSVTHAHQLAEDQQTLSKDKTGGAMKKYDPLNRAMTTLDGLRRSYMFTKEGQIGAQKNTFSPDVPAPNDRNASAALRLKNDEEYGKVADRVRAAAEQGQDPQAVLQQEMKPYFADKTKGYFESIMNFFSEPRNAEVLKTDKDFKGVEKTYRQNEKQYQQNLENAPGAQNPTYAPTKGPQFVATPDDAARQFLMDNNLLITPATIEKTKAYLKSKSGGK